ncbi:hypothetical protein [Nitrosovibrio sp. Nv6]|uniref:hypothetical protein n=1 Tax=Nitrosovibrio sp. Nv6 TaxID=1855340 RepID=UPI0008D01C4A|nr:hypothetical protein [Nitrosovibrio sp. Nv6]SEO77515.1 hypothetical protein SAMN05216316_1059 [Nitrosovibrio sp. Nv6]
MPKPQAPAAPDYKGAAIEQGAANKEAAIASSKLSNPNIINPYGRQTVTYDSAPTFDEAGYNAAMQRYQSSLGAQQNASPLGRLLGVSTSSPVAPDRSAFMSSGDGLTPTVTQTLSPEQQALFDQSNRISQGLGDLAEGGIDRVGSMLGTQFDMSKIPDQAVAGQQGWDNAYNAITQRNQPFMDRRREMTETQLSNQGIFRGSEAHGNAQRDLATQENDFNLGAQQQATAQQQAQFGMDTQARQNAISQEAFLRQLPLNEINALRSGAIINVPQFQGFQGQQMAASPIMQATQAQDQANMGRYNIQSGNANNMMSGLFGLGSSGMMAAGMMAM